MCDGNTYSKSHRYKGIMKLNTKENYTIAHLKEDELNKIKALEAQMGITLIAYENEQEKKEPMDLS